jgi:hypothetical protein
VSNGVSPELLRAMNDRVSITLRELGVEEGYFGCECGRTDCSERLELTLTEYAAREEGEALLAPGHERARAGVSP